MCVGRHQSQPQFYWTAAGLIGAPQDQTLQTLVWALTCQHFSPHSPLNFHSTLSSISLVLYKLLLVNYTLHILKYEQLKLYEVISVWYIMQNLAVAVLRDPA